MLLARVTGIESLDLGSQTKMIGLISYQYHTVHVVGYSQSHGLEEVIAAANTSCTTSISHINMENPLLQRTHLEKL
jgi:hypothetical protein